MWDAIRILLGSPSADEVALATIFAGSIIAFSFVPRIAEMLVGGPSAGEGTEEPPSEP